MSVVTLIILLFIICIGVFVVRSAVRVYKRMQHSSNSPFSFFSLSMLSIALVFLLVGTWMILQVSDTLGAALTALGGFFGLLESYVRRNREATPKKNPPKDE